ncbi:MAG: zinc-ribbon domain-containing protein [Lachnospiraceae bacterium]|nr:zinc-ribbon domain-containing protein [Lachnospiraceae bacterium]
MQCKKCGREVLDEDIFCTFCGTRQVQEENTSEKKNMSISLSDGQVTINKETLLGWIMKIGFFLLVCVLYIVSKEEMFDIAGFYQLTVSELVDIINNAELLFTGAEYEELVFFGNCFSGSIMFYLAACAFLLFNKYGLAGFCIVLGFLGALLGVGGIGYCMMNIAQEIGIDSIMQMIKMPFWIYAGLNVAILAYSIKYI